MKRSIGSTNLTQRDKALAPHVRAWELRMEGKSYREIAEILGVSLATVQNKLNAARTELRLHSVEYAWEERTRQCRELENIRRKLVEQLNREPTVDEAGDLHGPDLPRVATALVKLCERYAKLMGLDMPTRVEVSPGAPGESWQASLVALGWQPPAGNAPEVLPGLPAPRAEPDPDDPNVITVEVEE